MLVLLSLTLFARQFRRLPLLDLLFGFQVQAVFLSPLHLKGALSDRTKNKRCTCCLNLFLPASADRFFQTRSVLVIRHLWSFAENSLTGCSLTWEKSDCMGTLQLV